MNLQKRGNGSPIVSLPDEEHGPVGELLTSDPPAQLAVDVHAEDRLQFGAQ
jgi:hypothetical protein